MEGRKDEVLYSCPFRWFENLKFILSGVARPTRRGPLFKNTKARKPQLSRHYGTIHLSISFHRFDVRYWMSVGVKKGFHLSGEQLYLSSGVCVSVCWCNGAAVLPLWSSPCIFHLSMYPFCHPSVCRLVLSCCMYIHIVVCSCIHFVVAYLPPHFVIYHCIHFVIHLPISLSFFNPLIHY